MMKPQGDGLLHWCATPWKGNKFYKIKGKGLECIYFYQKLLQGMCTAATTTWAQIYQSKSSPANKAFFGTLLY